MARITLGKRSLIRSFIALWLLALLPDAAFAWECSAQSDMGMFGSSVWGESHNYGDRDAAEARALDECQSRGGNNYKTTYCVSDDGDGSGAQSEDDAGTEDDDSSSDEE